MIQNVLNQLKRKNKANNLERFTVRLLDERLSVPEAYKKTANRVIKELERIENELIKLEEDKKKAFDPIAKLMSSDNDYFNVIEDINRQLRKIEEAQAKAKALEQVEAQAKAEALEQAASITHTSVSNTAFGGGAIGKEEI